MIVTHEIKMDLVRRRSVPPLVEVVQNDRYSRDLALKLHCDGVKWSPGPGVSARVSYVKPDGTGGCYNFLPDETPAWRVEGNVVTVALAPQVCTAAGRVKLTVVLTKDAAELHTFLIELDVQKDPGLQATSADYYKLSGTLPSFGWEPGMRLGTDEAGDVVAVAPVEIDATLTSPGAAADAGAVGQRLGDLNGLETEDRSSLVAAINEVAGRAETGIQTINGVGPDEAGNLSLSISTLPVPASAQVGQYLRVTAVDDNGRVTGLEAVHISAGALTGYSYNGTELPDLPFLAAYPYVLIDADTETKFTAFCSETPLYITTLSSYPDRPVLMMDVPCSYYNLDLGSGDGAWVQGTVNNNWGGTFLDTINPLWTSCTVYNTDGSVYLAASEPEPVYDNPAADSVSGGLETVTLTTAFGMDATNELVVLTAEETALIDAAAVKGKPFILSFPLSAEETTFGTFQSVADVIYSESMGMYYVLARIYTSEVIIGKDSDGLCVVEYR